VWETTEPLLDSEMGSVVSHRVTGHQVWPTEMGAGRRAPVTGDGDEEIHGGKI
jgi:hypothetical protein